MEMSVDRPGRRLFVFGDIIVDYLSEVSGDELTGKRQPGGTAFNAALAFRDEGFDSIIVGALGNDENGKFIQAEMRDRGLSYRLLPSFLPTAECVLIMDHSMPRRLTNRDPCANAVNPVLLARALRGLEPDPGEPIFVAMHMLARRPRSECVEFFDIVSSLSERIIIDLVPHDLGSHVSGKTVRACLNRRAFLVVSEMRTIRALFVDHPDPSPAPTLRDWNAVFDNLAAHTVAIRYGSFGCEFECVAEAGVSAHVRVVDQYSTKFDSCPDIEKVGFGDRLTARLMRRLI